MSTPSATTSAAAHPAALRFYGLTLGAFFAASAAPTPLYRLYQEIFAISPLLVTLIFAIYAFSLLAALLVVGSISDHVGRRPAIAAALAVQAVALLLFLFAENVWFLLAARLVQGFATGAAASTLGAALADADARRGPLVNSLSPLLGMTVGALVTGALVQFGPEPMRLVYALLLAVVVAQLALLRTMPETASLRPGLAASLRPQVRIPSEARRAMAIITPINVALWVLGGFYLSLMPSLIVRATGQQSELLGGAVVAALMLSGATAVFSLRRYPPARALTVGAPATVAGIGTLVAGVHTGSVPVLFLGTAIAGIGFGASFLGCLGTVVPLAPADQRAELLSAFYVESYLAFSVPAIVAGFLASAIGIQRTTDIYAAGILLLVAAGFAGRSMFGLEPRAVAVPAACPAERAAACGNG
ncbi:MFS transporter [Jiella sp. M17.18]|uniref:MFS transporter n=1 Tax=Jiella sp. M17.18 TaxID=3234247 RepID=UPI0034DEC34D